MTLAAFARVVSGMQTYVSAGGSVMLATFVINVARAELRVR